MGNKLLFNLKQIKLPTYLFIVYILLIPFESLWARPIFATMASYATYAATLTSISVGFYLLLKPNMVKLTKTAIPWIAYFFWAAISIYFSIDRLNSLSQYFFIAKHIFFYLFICSYPFNIYEKRAVRHAIITFGVVLSVYTLVSSYYFGDITTTLRATIKNAHYRADPNHLAASLILPFAFLIVEFVENKKSQFLDFAAASIMFATLIVSGSRGGFVGLGMLVVAFLIMYWRTVAKAKAIMILMLSFVIFGLIFSYIRPDLLERFTVIEGLDRFSSKRTLIWSDAVKEWQKSPLVGLGFGSFLLSNVEKVSYYKSAHNNYLQALMETGIVGALLQVAAAAAVISVRTKDGFSRASKAGAIGVLTTGLFLYNLSFDYFWLSMMMVEISIRARYKESV